MKLNIDILASLREIYEARSEPEGVRALAGAYWRTLLLGAFITLVVVFLYATSDLLGVLSALATSTDTSAPPPPAFSRTTLNDIVATFQSRQERFANFKSNLPPLIPDPSR